MCIWRYNLLRTYRVCVAPIRRQFAWKYGLWLKFPVITIVTPTQCIRINIFLSWYSNTVKCDVTVREFLMNFLCIPMQMRLSPAAFNILITFLLSVWQSTLLPCIPSPIVFKILVLSKLNSDKILHLSIIRKLLNYPFLI